MAADSASIPPEGAVTRFLGNWALDFKGSESISPFLKRVGVPWIGRQVADNLRTYLVIGEVDGGLKITVKGFKEQVMELKWGTTVTVKTMMDDLRPATMTWVAHAYDSGQPGLQVHVLFEDKGFTVTHTYWMDATEEVLHHRIHWKSTTDPAETTLIRRLYRRA